MSSILNVMSTNYGIAFDRTGRLLVKNSEKNFDSSGREAVVPAVQQEAAVGTGALQNLTTKPSLHQLLLI
jgi:hypothetical protein